MSEEMKEVPVPEAPKTEAPVVTPVEEAPKAETAASEASDVEQNKVMAIVGYIIPILFFVPMLSEKKSPFGMFHANQQLVLLITAILVQVVGAVIPFIGWFIILPFGTIAVIVIAIIGLVNAVRGEMKPLPVIGGFSIIK